MDSLNKPTIINQYSDKISNYDHSSIYTGITPVYGLIILLHFQVTRIVNDEVASSTLTQKNLWVGHTKLLVTHQYFLFKTTANNL